MLVTKLEEIQEYLPGNVLSSFTMIRSFVRQSEASFILPVLGRPLYNKLTQEYDAPTQGLIATDGNWRALLEAVQYPLINYAFHNAIPKLNVALAPGGGATVMTGANQEIASKERVSDLKASVLADAHAGIDLLLRFLEDDARCTAPQFAELWRQSEYFYLYQGSLVNTADVFNRSVDIDGSRLRFTKLKPDIALCETMFIRPAITPELTDALIDYAAAPDKTESAGYAELLPLVQSALSLYVASRDKSLATPRMADEAGVLINEVRRRVEADPDRYPAYKQSARYREAEAARIEAEQAAARGEQQQAEQTAAMHGSVFFIPGGFHH